jgi:UDP-N-acetyl-D-glucosamine dehydrogenase
MLNHILKKIENREYNVGIIGLGYVGLPLMWTFFNHGFKVTGFDIDPVKIESFKKGKSYLKTFSNDDFKRMTDSGLVSITTDFNRISEPDCILMCVPTPLDEHREPDMSYVVNTVETVAPHLRKGQLIVLESTTYPGTTDEIITPICEKVSGLKSGVDFYVAYSPEREDPGNPDFSTGTIPKVIGADGPDALKIAEALYGSVIVKTVPVSNNRTAEAVKLLENIFRSVNIALVNELKVVFQEMDIDVHEVIEAASTKPFGFMKFTPGPGLGGHCIPIDPFYLTWKAREFGVNTRFIELAGEVNTSMPHYVVKRTMEALNSRKKPVNGSKILLIGLAYKPNVDDVRESPTFVLMDLLDKHGAEVSYYDPYVPVIQPTREHAHWTGTKSIEWNEKVIRGFDAVLISTNHTDIDYDSLLDWSDVIIDSRNVYKDKELFDKKVVKA